MDEQGLIEQNTALMQGLAAGIDEVLNGPREPGKKPRLGFILLVSEFGQITDGRVNYVSNGDRDSMLAMLREYLARVEGRYLDGTETKN